MKSSAAEPDERAGGLLDGRWPGEPIAADGEVEYGAHLPLPIGPAEVCAERLTALVTAGARRIFVWPLGDEAKQLELFRERVIPLIPRSL